MHLDERAIFRHIGESVILEKHPRIFSANLSGENCLIGKEACVCMFSASDSAIFDFLLACCINIDDIHEVLCSRELYLIYFPLHLLFCYHGETVFLKLSIIKYLRLCCS